MLQNLITKSIENFKFLYNKNLSLLLFLAFLGFNLFFFISNFINTFLNSGGNADEYYLNNLYSYSNVTAEKIFYTPSQIYILLCSILNEIIDNPSMSTRLISLIAGIFLILYFVKKFNFKQDNSLEKIYKITLFVCAIFITNQIFIGTSDFLAISFIVPAFLILIESIKSKKIVLIQKKCAFVGFLFAISIATRPTSLVLIFSFYISFLFLCGIKNIFCKENFTILFSGIFVFFLINFLPIIQKQQIILDVKEVPVETGVNWFQRNYLMAKYWDANMIPNTQWISTQEVIDYKKDNPNFTFPKNQIALLISEPGLYFRQMVRMFTKALYTNYRFIYLLFPLLFLSFLRFKINNNDQLNNFNKNNLFQNKIIIIFHFISIIIFSFLAVKLFESRWVIPTLILYSYFALNYLALFPLKVRFIVYNISFISGILMYSLFFFKT